jgi:hypothetical protein
MSTYAHAPLREVNSLECSSSNAFDDSIRKSKELEEEAYLREWEQRNAEAHSRAEHPNRVNATWLNVTRP